MEKSGKNFAIMALFSMIVISMTRTPRFEQMGLGIIDISLKTLLLFTGGIVLLAVIFLIAVVIKKRKSKKKKR